MKRVISARLSACPLARLTFASSAFRKSTFLLLTTSLIAGSAACGGGSSKSNPITPLPDGNYVFSLAGSGKGDVAGNNVAHPLYFVAGVFTVSDGVISAGEQDLTDAATNDNDQINPTGSSIAKTSDGNLQITLTTCAGTSCVTADQRVGVSGVETLDCSFLGASFTKAYIAEFDANFSGSGIAVLGLDHSVRWLRFQPLRIGQAWKSGGRRWRPQHRQNSGGSHSGSGQYFRPKR
jgi:hypothetical protein